MSLDKRFEIKIKNWQNFDFRRIIDKTRLLFELKKAKIR